MAVPSQPVEPYFCRRCTSIPRDQRESKHTTYGKENNDDDNKLSWGKVKVSRGPVGEGGRTGGWGEIGAFRHHPLPPTAVRVQCIVLGYGLE